MTHPLARSGRWLSSGCGRRTRVGPELDRQPVDQPRQLALARRLLDQAVLRGAQILGPVGGQREGIEAEFGVERAPPCRRAGAADASARGWESRSRPRPTATLPSTRKPVQRQPPRAEMPLLQLRGPGRGSAARAPGSPLRDGSPAPPAGAPRAAAGRPARRSAARACGRAPGRARRRRPRPRETAAPARAAACPISAPMVLRPSRSSVRTVSGIEPQRGDGQRRSALCLRDHRAQMHGCMMRQRPGRRGGRRNRDARRQPERGEAALDIARPARARRRTDARLR